ncbi:hypothetical protein P7C71_g1764, partial [Lecanoromycetidae sp. Uapishka_2]
MSVIAFDRRIGETPSDEPTARHAVSLIATHRNSDLLRRFLETGTVDAAVMDVKEAYLLFSIQNPQEIDDRTFLTIYDSSYDDALDTKRRKQLKNAFKAIAEDRDSSFLRDTLSGGGVTPKYELSEWPVGLKNIGNTCYLNSMLQSYFTIKPLRELVLNIGDLMMVVDEGTLRSKRVGGRLITEEEVTRSQRFKPEAKLVHLALIKAKKDDGIPKKPADLGQNHSLPARIPDHEDTEMLDGDSSDLNGSNNLDSAGINASDSKPGCSPATILDDDSDIGLLGQDGRKIDSGGPEDKENLPLTKLLPGGLKLSSSPNENELSSPPNSATVAPEGEIGPTVDSGSVPVKDSTNTQGDQSTTSHPDRKPTMPPRPQTEEEKLLEQAEDSASRQEDVQELIDNVLFQLQCAIKAGDIDKDTGEQIDGIKHLFYGKQKVYITDADGDIRPQESYFFNIIVNANKGSIYGALDDSLYCQRRIHVGEAIGSEYTTITQLPPVLQIFVQRTGYKEGKGAFKMNDHLQLQDSIYMDRYMDHSTKTNLEERHKKIWTLMSGLQDLIELKEKVILDKVSNTKRHEKLLLIQQQEMRYRKACGGAHEEVLEIEKNPKAPRATDRLKNVLKENGQLYDKKVDSMNDKIERLRAYCAKEFDDLKDMEYRLQSVFFHSGGSNAGHYWVYIYDFVKTEWRKYNDGKVEKANRAEIFEPNPKNPDATPYFLVYVKADEIAKLVDCVHRYPIQKKLQEDTDIKMDDDSDLIESTQGHGDRDANQGSPGGADGGYEDINISEDSLDRGWNNHEAPHGKGPSLDNITVAMTTLMATQA